MCLAAGRWQCTAAHRLWRLECPRQQCWSLTCVLGPQQAAAVAAAAACCCLIQSSQRCSEACRIRAVWYLLRLSAFRPGDRSWMVRWSSLRPELHRTIHGRTVERDVVSGEMYRKTKKHGSDACLLYGPFPANAHPPLGVRALLPVARYRSSGPLGALLSSPALDVRLITALQVLQVPLWERERFLAIPNNSNTHT